MGNGVMAKGPKLPRPSSTLPTRTHGHVRFRPAIGGQADINSASSDRLGLLGIPVHPASLIRLAGAIFMILGVVLIRT
jgi:hypothetical protein